jgi:uncharacterized RDD family membrane protein YckC
MSQFGSPGRKPGRPSGGQPSGASPLRGNYANKQPSFRESEEEETGLASITPKTSAQRMRSGQAVELVKIEPSKRLVALIFDCLACYVLGLVLSIVPFLMRFLTIGTTWILLLLVKDFFFDGRGIGKNIMGLQVVDVATGKPCSLKQSVMRNIVLVAPFAVLQVVSLILDVTQHFFSVAWLSATLKDVINWVGMIYVAVVLPMECYRAYNRDDSQRIGDQLAGTAVIESSMDFSNPFSK